MPRRALPPTTGPLGVAPLSSFDEIPSVTQLRGLAWLALTDVGQVGAGSITGDTGGGGVTSWTYGTLVPCRIDPLSERMGRVTGGQIDERSTHMVTVPPGIPVTASNRFAITNRGTFEVTAARVRTGAKSQVFEVIQIS